MRPSRVTAGFYEGLEIPIDREWLVIGRGRSAEMTLAEPTISRAHAAIGYDGRGFFVQDLRSTNGTLVNGEPRARRPLGDEDEIQLGRLQLRFRRASGLQRRDRRRRGMERYSLIVVTDQTAADPPLRRS